MNTRLLSGMLMAGCIWAFAFMASWRAFPDNPSVPITIFLVAGPPLMALALARALLWVLTGR